MTTYRSMPRQSGKTMAFYDETLRLWREHFEDQPLICHPDEYRRHRAGITAAAERAGYPVPVTLHPDPYRGTRGALLAYDSAGTGAYVGSSRPGPHRVYASWRRAALNARSFAAGTGWKHRISRAGEGFFMVSMVEKRVDWGPAWAKPLGTVRMTVTPPDSVVPQA